MSSCSLMLPLWSASISSMMRRQASKLSICCLARCARCSSLLPSLASAALSTMIASTKFVKPSCTETSAPAKMKYAHAASSMTGIAQAPQESPATKVWKKSSVENSTELNAFRHQESSSVKILLLTGLMSSTAKRDHATRSINIITMPQNMTCIAPVNPPIMFDNVGKRLRILKKRRIRATRMTRRTFTRFSSGMSASAMPASPTPTMTMSNTTHLERKHAQR
mmetsp:Transcript_21648/g.61286  ORF Transcript_21648/g.61286 Transcript_21648/m.61286 type:complete len:223 (+) Transcript_21648:16-684(+)